MRRLVLLVAGGLAGVGGCREPTQITVELRTDVACASVFETTLAVGTLSSILTKPPVATQKGCRSADGRIGSVVVVPSGDKDDEVAVQAVMGVSSQPPGTCDPLQPGPNCVVARRSLRYVPHTPLFLPIELDQSCLGAKCDKEETCVDGACVTAKLPDPETCTTPGGCSQPKDAGSDAPPDLPTAGLVIHYAFDDSNPGWATDSSGKGNDGALVNGAQVVPTDGHSGGALKLTGQWGSMVQTQTSASLQAITPQTGLTVAMWINPSAFPQAGVAGFLVWKYGQDIDFAVDPADNRVCIDVLYLDPGGGGFDNTYSACSGPAAAPFNEYHHVAFTYGDSTIALYIDGVIVSQAKPSGANFSIKEALFFGNGMEGFVDELVLYSRALSSAEVAALASL